MRRKQWLKTGKEYPGRIGSTFNIAISLLTKKENYEKEYRVIQQDIACGMFNSIDHSTFCAALEN